MSSLLVVNPSQRISCSECLTHPWIMKCTSDNYYHKSKLNSQFQEIKAIDLNMIEQGIEGINNISIFNGKTIQNENFKSKSLK